ncbi:hypothetical protein ACH5RR_018465 [Cinchona calisaya]|uniref:Phosphoribosylglycinamide formyltransferase, chloroplastic n=1 Tax=Cinchona calisaya TaxID=153742 RepID=A0ABD2ZN70_9GENT
MEIQSSIFGISSFGIHNPKTPFFPSKATPLSAPKQVLFKTHFSLSSNLSFTKQTLKVSASVAKVECEIGTINIFEDGLKRKIRKKNLAVFVSGGGSNFKSLHEATVNGFIHGDISVLVTNKPDCGGAEFARDKGIPVISFPKLKDGSGLSSHVLVTALRSYKVDFILLAGFLKLLPAELIKAYPRSILNIHPSLLPAFGGKGYYGMKVHEAVIASGARYSGPTIHYVDEEYDRGRILAQRIVPVLANDTAEELAGRVLHEEHKLYQEVVAALCEDRIIWREDGVPLIQCKENPNLYM